MLRITRLTVGQGCQQEWWVCARIWRLPKLGCWTCPGRENSRRWWFRIGAPRMTRRRTCAWTSHPSSSLAPSSARGAALERYIRLIYLLSKRISAFIFFQQQQKKLASTFSVEPVVVLFINRACHAEIPELSDPVCVHEAVPAGHVPVKRNRVEDRDLFEINIKRAHLCTYLLSLR